MAESIGALAAGILDIQNIEADGARFRALGSDITVDPASISDSGSLSSAELAASPDPRYLMQPIASADDARRPTGAIQLIVKPQSTDAMCEDTDA